MTLLRSRLLRGISGTGGTSAIGNVAVASEFSGSLLTSWWPSGLAAPAGGATLDVVDCQAQRLHLADDVVERRADLRRRIAADADLGGLGDELAEAQVDRLQLLIGLVARRPDPLGGVELRLQRPARAGRRRWPRRAGA